MATLVSIELCLIRPGRLCANEAGQKQPFMESASPVAFGLRAVDLTAIIRYLHARCKEGWVAGVVWHYSLDKVNLSLQRL